MHRRAVDRTLAVLLALWALVSVLPIGAWSGVAPFAYYAASVALWWRTLLVAVLVTALLLALSKGAIVPWLRGGTARALSCAPRSLLAVLGVAAAAEATLASWLLFDRTAPLVDAWVQAFQARIFLSGSLVAPLPRSPAHFATLFMPMTERGWFSQYPPVHSALLAVGLAGGAMWLVTPVLAAALPAAVYLLARPSGDERVARLAALLVLASPFVVAMDASATPHLPAALCVALGLWAATDARLTPLRAGAILGAAAGVAFGIRPVDAAVLVLVGVTTLIATRARARAGALFDVVVALAACAAAYLVALAPTLLYNAATTGSALRFTYSEVWGELLGLRRGPWGERLTVLRALGNTAVDAHQINVYLLDWPVPVTALIALGVWRGGARLDGARRAAAAYLLGLVAVLFFYFHRDTLFGPRLLFSAVPVMLVLLAHGLVRLTEWRRPVGWHGLAAGDVAGLALIVTAVLAVAALAPRRLASYRTAGSAIALHPETDARRAGLRDAVVLIPDGFGSRLIARLWQAGVPMRDSARVYAAFDACTLADLLAETETRGWSAAEFRTRLDGALVAADRGRPIAGLTRDPLLRVPSDGQVSARCAEEIRRDQQGTLQYAPYLYLNTPALDGDVVWARELGPADGMLARSYPGRTLYRYVVPLDGGAGEFVPVAPPDAWAQAPK